MKRMVLAALVFLGIAGVLTVPAAVRAKININTAGVSELGTLPRIGPGLARAIVDFRETHGLFRTIHDITNVPQIGDKTFEFIRDYITVGDVSALDSAESGTREEQVPGQTDTATGIEPIRKMESLPVSTPAPVPSVEEIMALYETEPTIHEVHRAVLEYASINQGTFQQWRRDVKRRALLPETFQVTVGHDTDDDTDYSRSKTISLTGGTVTIGPDDQTWGHDTDSDWDYELRLKWNFQDYLFHADMLRVSAETEDQVELRQDLLNEVTRLYFDRRRLQVEMFLEPDVDIHTQMKRVLRLDELTAALDAVTNGFFSEKLLENQSVPE
ncbi:helix-hairpin-helix domain-containing protein [bacterium]|nr:helix-hairpin-helix domain-containing protein [candidate division CSSED10-310 bacterium]